MTFNAILISTYSYKNIRQIRQQYRQSRRQRRQNVAVYKIMSIDAKKTGHDKIRIAVTYLSICCSNDNHAV